PSFPMLSEGATEGRHLAKMLWFPADLLLAKQASEGSRSIQQGMTQPSLQYTISQEGTTLRSNYYSL
ncbi:hypothetical protein PMAYCL1PPCAC_05423, partial [Pristionchus mayeri]